MEYVSKDKFDELVLLVHDMAKSRMGRSGQSAGQTAVIAALVRTHPDPQAFAAALRSTWQEADEPHTDAMMREEYMEAARAVLAMVEKECPAPLGIRPAPIVEPMDSAEALRRIVGYKPPKPLGKP